MISPREPPFQNTLDQSSGVNTPVCIPAMWDMFVVAVHHVFVYGLFLHVLIYSQLMSGLKSLFISRGPAYPH